VRHTAAALCLLLSAGFAAAQTPVFLEPLAEVNTNRAEVRERMPLYRQVEGEKYRPWLNNELAQRAFRAYATAFKILQEKGNPQKQPVEYYIAVLPGGNHASVGFRIQRDNNSIEEHPRHAYVLLSPNERSFGDTLLHETGHVAMAMLAGGRQHEGSDLASIPHSTAALSNRATAFSEGYAIHWEAVGAHYATSAAARQRFHREGVVFGDGPYQAVEFFRGASDLASYSQNVSRYLDVRENHFSFEPAFKGPDYLRVQLEKARDFASIRDAGALVQSEGFVASAFFLWMIRGAAKPSEEILAQREERAMRAMREVFDSVEAKPETPWLLEWAIAYMRLFPEEKSAMTDALLDLSHGAFADRTAAEMWRKHYLATLQIDQKQMDLPGIMSARKKWRDQIAGDPRLLLAQLGPELRCEVGTVEIKIAVFGSSSPLVLDINTAPEGVLRMIPGLSGQQREKWLSQRPFTSLAAFRQIVGTNACAP